MALTVEIKSAYLPTITVDLLGGDDQAHSYAVGILKPQIRVLSDGAELYRVAPAGAPPEAWNPIPLYLGAVLLVLGAIALGKVVI